MALPTRRAFLFLILASILYFLANQTQVGWIYVFSQILIALCIIAFAYNWRIFSRIKIDRQIRLWSVDNDGLPSPGESILDREKIDLSEMTLFELQPAFHEDDPVEVILTINQSGWRPLFLIKGEEDCPLAPSEARNKLLFITALFRKRPVVLRYQIQCDRRGRYTFPNLPLSSNGPFGLFRSRRSINATTDVLVFPYYYPLRRWRMMANWLLSRHPARRIGATAEFIGARDYRPGDTLRQIHWRNTARTGKLIVKEFAQEDDLQLTIVLDLMQGASLGHGKFSTFEAAIRIAASLAYYATQHDIPFRLVGADPAHQLSANALSWWSCLTYLAKVIQDGQQPLAQFLPNLSDLTFTVVLVSRPDDDLIQALLARQQLGHQLLPLFITLDGVMPPAAHRLTGAVSVSPHTWPTTLATW